MPLTKQQIEDARSLGKRAYQECNERIFAKHGLIRGELINRIMGRMINSFLYTTINSGLTPSEMDTLMSEVGKTLTESVEDAHKIVSNEQKPPMDKSSRE